MATLDSALLGALAFSLGACPFSFWVGKWLLGKDIRRYGDGNPGAANVFRAGGRKAGCLAVALDVAKGVPFVTLAYSLYGLPTGAVLAVGLCAILGHAFSPLLRFRGGKSVAVTYGVLLALPERELLVAFAVGMLVGFLVVESDAWTVMLGPLGALAYLVAAGADHAAAPFVLGVLVVFAVRHWRELQTAPSYSSGRAVGWLRSLRSRA